jgi:hypothetical protein
MGSDARPAHLLDTNQLEARAGDAVDEVLPVDHERVDGGGGGSQATHGGEEFCVRLVGLGIVSVVQNA